MSGLDSDKDVKKIYSKVDELPKSIKTILSPKMNMDKIKSISLFLVILYVLSALFSYIHTNTLNKDNILKSYYYKASIFKYITSFIVDTKPSSSFWNRRFIIFIIAFTFIFVFILFLLCKDKTVKLISLMKWIHQ